MYVDHSVFVRNYFLVELELDRTGEGARPHMARASFARSCSGFCN
jgi:hypothetical protein